MMRTPLLPICLPICLLIFLLILLFPVPEATAMKNLPEKTAIVIAAFGTTYPAAVDALLAIVRDVEACYPETPVKMAFTSNIIRKKWHGRAADPSYRQQHPQVPDYFYRIKNLLGTLADLQDEGYQTIVVQPTHLTPGEEYLDVAAYIKGLLSIETVKQRWRPFHKIALGRPLMGVLGADHPYAEDLDKLATALKPDMELAKAGQATLVYMGHGNEHLSTGLYAELEELMNRRYPQIKTRIGLVEGEPDVENVLENLQRDNANKLLLKPLMVVAGDHANNDMAGAETDSWKSKLEAAGFQTEPMLRGLGENPAVRQLFIAHLQDAAREAGIELH
jgi:sirohydrochlorin cobaltochelatase